MCAYKVNLDFSCSIVYLLALDAPFCMVSSCFCGCDNNMASSYIYFSLMWPGPVFAQGRHYWFYKCHVHKI